MVKPKKQLNGVSGYDHQLYIEDFKIKLDSNENLLGPSEKVVDVLKHITGNDVKFYPAYGELISTIAGANNVSDDMVLPTNGGDEAICYLLNTFLEEDENIVTAVPTFVMSKIYARISNSSYKEVPYKRKWVYPIDDVLAAIDEKTKIVLVTTPNSPTGDSISEDNLLRIIEKAQAQNTLVMIDQTYGSYSERNYVSFASKFDNVAVVRSMSKDFALAGLRLGYIISNAENINHIKKIFNPFSVNIIAAKAGVASLKDTEHFKFVRDEILRSKDIVTEGLKDVATVYPSDGNFLCIDFKERAQYIYKKLLKHGIKVKFMHEGLVKNCFRVTMPSNKDAYELVEVIKKTSKLLIFDIDGVLVDTSKSYRMAIKSTFEFFAKKELSFDKIREAKNLGGLNNDWDLTEYLLKEDGVRVPKQAIIDKFQMLYFGHGGDGLIRNESLLISKEELEELSKDFDLAVFTGRPKTEAEFILKYFGIYDLFSPIITMNDVPEDRQKPYPDGILKIVDIVQPSETYYLGDTQDDMLAAKTAEVKGIGILPPQDKSETLKQLMSNHQPVVILENTKDIINYMGAIR